MNRKERRAAGKRSKSPGLPAFRSAESSRAFTSAVQLHQAGQLQQAEDIYKKILASEPNQADTLHLLGVIASQTGRNETAIDLIGKAIAVDSSVPAFHYNIGFALQSILRIEEAVVHYKKTISLNPNFVEARNNLGAALRQQGDLEGAIAEYQSSLAIKPDCARAHTNLADALHVRGKFMEALSHYQRALDIRPESFEGYRKIAIALLAQDDAAKALAFARRGLEVEKSQAAKALFFRCVHSVRDPASITDIDDLRPNLVEALSEPWGRPGELARFTARFVRRNSAVSECIKRATSNWPRRLPAEELFGPSEVDRVCDDELLRCLLEATPVCEIELERLLTGIRMILLDTALESSPVNETFLSFCCALARQCFINEYVFYCSEDELDKAKNLKQSLEIALEYRTAVSPIMLAAVAAYFPLHSLRGAAAILERSWPQVADDVVTQQLREPQEELHYRTAIPRLTAIEDEVSLLVQRQYEENPYPQWVKAAPMGTPETVGNYLRREFPTASLRSLGEGSGVRILVAGCGSGQQAVETAQLFIGALVLAVDLSLTSLCYATRKTHALGLENIRYAQADIMQLGSINQNFDVIEATGVLHHLGDPLAGWRVLLSILRPGGVMRVGLYSELGRQDISMARAFISKHGYSPIAEDIRKCRQELMKLDDAKPLKNVTKSRDFFSVSACRDMLFHAHEHRLTLTAIKSFLAENNLRFLGFNIDGRMLTEFCKQFPGKHSITDLDAWHMFETRNPAAFAGMYQLWIQKS